MALSGTAIDPRLVFSGDPAAGTDAVQTLQHSGTVSGGTYVLEFEGYRTGDIARLTTTAALETALNALPSLGNGGTGVVGVVVTTPGGTMGSGTALTVTFSGSAVAKRPHALLVLDATNLTGGGTIAIAHGTPGVAPFGPGLNAVQTLATDGTVSAGLFWLSFEGYHTGPIAWTADTAILETALNTLPNLASGGTGAVGVVVTGGPFPGTALRVTFSGSHVAKRVVGALTLHATDLTGGGTVVIEPTRAGVRPFGADIFGGVAPGAQGLDGKTGVVYYNSNTKANPVWTAV